MMSHTISRVFNAIIHLTLQIMTKTKKFLVMELSSKMYKTL